MNEAAQYLTDGVTLAVLKHGKVQTFEERGIKALLFLLGEQPELLRGAIVADRIVGRAAAFLFVLGGVKDVYAQTLSAGARELLLSRGITCSYLTLTDMIVNRQGTGQCPMESAVAGMTDPSAAYLALKAKAAELASKRG